MDSNVFNREFHLVSQHCFNVWGSLSLKVEELCFIKVTRALQLLMKINMCIVLNSSAFWVMNDASKAVCLGLGCKWGTRALSFLFGMVVLHPCKILMTGPYTLVMERSCCLTTPSNMSPFATPNSVLT